ncbi:MAG: hexose kinase [Acidobacteria bacterium]|nr:hexose kinase [Acidobacteriota bacterium]
MSNRIVCLGAFPSIQRVLRIDELRVGRVNRVRAVSVGASGKGVNAARAVKALGGLPVAIGFSGGESGRRLRRMLREEGIAWRPVLSEALVRTCQTLLDVTRREATEVVEEATVPPAPVWEILTGRYTRLLPGAAGAIISGNLPSGAPTDALPAWVRNARDRGLPVIVDTRGPAFLKALAERPFLVKPNREELAFTLQRTLDTEQSCLEACRVLRSFGAEWALVTDGPRTALLVGPVKAWGVIPPSVDVVNPIGAGDTLAGALALALARGEKLPEAARYAFGAAAASCLTEVPGALDPQAVDALARACNLVKLRAG